jgi:hypothetical protein
METEMSEAMCGTNWPEAFAVAVFFVAYFWFLRGLQK